MHHGWRGAGVASLFFLASSAFAGNFQHETDWSKTGASFYLGAYGGSAVVFLGSNDIRSIAGISAAYGFASNRFKLWSVPAQLVFEADLEESHSNGNRFGGPNSRVGGALMPYVRWRGRTNHGIGGFFDAGFGLYVSQTTLDLNSAVSTSPMLGAGIAVRQGKNEWLVGLRYRHASNGGTTPPNAGQNAFLLTVTYRF